MSDVDDFLRQIAAANPEISPEGLLSAIFPGEPVPTNEQIALEKTNNPLTEMDMAFYRAISEENSSFIFRHQRYFCATYAQDRLNGLKTR